MTDRKFVHHMFIFFVAVLSACGSKDEQKKAARAAPTRFTFKARSTRSFTQPTPNGEISCVQVRAGLYTGQASMNVKIYCLGHEDDLSATEQNYQISSETITTLNNSLEAIDIESIKANYASTTTNAAQSDSSIYTFDFLLEKGSKETTIDTSDPQILPPALATFFSAFIQIL